MLINYSITQITIQIMSLAARTNIFRSIKMKNIRRSVLAPSLSHKNGFVRNEHKDGFMKEHLSKISENWNSEIGSQLCSRVPVRTSFNAESLCSFLPDTKFKIVNIDVNDGVYVDENSTIMSIETSKVVIDIHTPVGGIIKLFTKKGQDNVSSKTDLFEIEH